MLTVTDLATYTYCPRKLYISKVLGVKEPLKKQVVLGRIRHEAFDLMNKQQELIISSITKIDKKFIEGLFRKEYSNALIKSILNNKVLLKNFNLNTSDVFKTAWKFMLLELKQRTELIYNFILKTGFLGETLWQELEPKIKSEVEVKSESLKLIGRVDQLLYYKDNVVPVELKTGKAPVDGVWPSHKIQVEAYVLLVGETTKLKVNKAVVKYLDTMQERTIVANPFFEYEIKKLVLSINELLSSKRPPKICANKNKCRYCGLRDFCFAHRDM